MRATGKCVERLKEDGFDEIDVEIHRRGTPSWIVDISDDA